MSNPKTRSLRSKLHDIIYEADTPAGKMFDIILLFTIITSIILVMLESVDSIDKKYHDFLNNAEWVITILFSIEYIARIATVKQPLKYITSFYGIIDLLSTIPKYLSFMFTGSHALVALRALRLLRVFRILKLDRYLGASENLIKALKASRTKISIFLYAVLILAIILGTIMYIVEGPEHGFTNIPKSVYWCIVTMTTVGFGDITPQTPLGQFIAAIIMVTGYGIIAVPTGIVTAEITKKGDKKIHTNTQSCDHCSLENHRDDADFCYHCGEKLRK
ncbi:MAG: ion transporter [Bacteroidetes bacterium MedPE-SWsnd-G2]|nr:MAG: ion transporter [Bacteroidetes bacterium MedPE-SWsnd-G2]